jgi:hypothetical protein
VAGKLSHVHREKGAAVHAVVIRFTINDRLALATELEEVVREVSAAPGFVAVYGVAVGQDQGISILVFDSEVSASLEALASRVAEHRAVTVATVEVGEVVAHA